MLASLTNQRLVNLRNVLNYQFTLKNNVFAVVILFIAIIIPFSPNNNFTN